MKKIEKEDKKKDNLHTKNEKENDSKRKYLIILLLLLLICIFGISVTFGKDIYENIENQIIETFKLDKPTSPVIDGGSNDWKKESIIKVVKDAYTKNGLDYYEYCISENKSTKKCDFKKTETKNVKISVTGKYYVTFRAVDKEGKKGNLSNTEVVFIDNQNPVITNVIKKEITTNSIQIEVSAKDEHSGIEGYYYSIDGSTYEKGKSTYTYSNLEIGKEYTIYVKVVDKVGNITVLSMQVKTKENDNEITPNPTDSPNPTESPLPTDNENGNQNSSNPTNNGSTNPSVTPTPTETPAPTTTPSSAPTISPSPSTTPTPDEEKENPVINLDKVPSSFTYGEKYDLPSYVSFGKDTGTYSCVVEGNEYKDTSTLKIGKHLIVCTATSSKNIRVIVEKEVEVVVETGSEEVWNGWIRLNLYYPENSINWQWRIGKEGEIRDGYENTEWQDYTGPILVKLEDVENVYIRYDLLGETYIVAPSGKVAVDIEPDKYTIKKDEKVKVKIYYDSKAEIKEYRIGTSEWKSYIDEFEVEANTIIEARATRKEKVYNSDGDYVYTKTITGTDSVFISEYVEAGNNGGTTSGGNTGSIIYEPVTRIDGTITTKPTNDSKPSTYLAGPVITSNPSSEIVSSVKVKVTPQEVADKIYIKIGNGNYQEYTNEVEISNNTVIRAYYIRRSDGQVSDTSYYYVQNIKKESKPYVRIDTNPTNYLNGTQKSVEVSISGSNYNRLLYSLDGVIYQDYTNPITVTESSTIYAKGINDVGETIESLVIPTVEAPQIKKNIDITISLNPGKEEIEGLVNKTKVSISYDSKATKKYYKIGYFGEWKEYAGEFEVTSNTTVYAYATGNNAVGRSDRSISFLTTGISNPIINVNTTSKTQQVKVTIDYDENAEITRYQIGNGPLLDYNGSFYVYENTTIRAYNKNSLGYEAESKYTINNIVSAPDYLVIEKGKYFIIKLNYPQQASVKEYKWKANGTWKEYDSKGILLIKPEYKDEFDMTGKDGIQVEDDKGNKVIFTDHYYLIDVPFSELMENLFMRWDSVRPSGPSIIVEPSTPTKETEVIINYDKSLVKKYYKIVEEDGTDTGWLEYTGSFKINKNNSIIYAKGETRNEIESNVSSKKVTNIDLIAPDINIKGDFTTPKQKVTVTVDATDNIMMYMVKWASGEHDAKYFKGNGESLRNYGNFKAEENGKYTIYAVDQAGNETVKVIEVNNIDKEAPNIIIDVLTERYGTTAEVSIDYTDSKIKEYRIGKNSTEYKSYTDILTINANDVLSLVNEDGSLTIYARGTDEAGNVKEVSEDIYVLDLDAPKEPIIYAGAGYPILTEYGVKLGADSYIVYDDTRDDIINYYSIDNGKTWKVYTGSFEIASGTITAKSVKKVSGLTISTTKKVDMPSDALGANAYDEDENTYVSKGIFYINVSDELYNKNIVIKYSSATNSNSMRNAPITINMLDGNNQILNTISYSFKSSSIITNSSIKIENGTKKLQISIPYSGVSWDYNFTLLREIAPYSIPTIQEYKYYPTLTEYGVEAGYNEVGINYFQTSVDRFYRINEGEWKNYQDKLIHLEIGDKLEAKGIDKYGVETNISSYTSNLPSDALGANAYDEDENTYVSKGIFYINVSDELYNKNIVIKYSSATNSNSMRNAPITINMLDGNNQILNTISYSFKSSSIITNSSIKIENGTKKLQISIPYSGVSWDYNFTLLREIAPYSIPTMSENNYYSNLNLFGLENTYNEVVINYLSYFAKKLYSLDNGKTWLDYTEPFKAEAGIKIIAKAIDKDGNETEAATYTVMGLTDNMPNEVFDNNKETSSFISKNSTKSFGLNGVDNNTLRIYTTGTVSSNSYIKLFDNSNQELASISLNKNLTTLVIPTGSVKASVYSGSSTLTITEINLRTNVIKDNSPLIEINDVNWTVNKTIDITYPEGYRNEYSLDLGETWIEYLSPITMEKETIVLARVVDNDKVVSSSSFTITKIDDEEPTISLDIPDKLHFNSNYSLPTSYTVGKSGGTPICKIEDNFVNNTKDLKIGNYEITCLITNGVNVTKTVSKTIEILSDAVYDYVGKEQTYVVVKTGLYRLETWGAQGADATTTYIGGYGGYSSGNIMLDEGTVLYINVGGMGGKYTYSANKVATAKGGYNGGGYGHVNSSNWDYRYLYAGGGATHIALKSGMLSSLEQEKDSILVVSGGGGSGSAQRISNDLYSYTKGGSGGGITGNSMLLVSRKWTCGIENSNTFYSTGGNQESGGIFAGCSSIYDSYNGLFGQGLLTQSSVNSNSADWGGGGGFYGGSIGAGGSGYIGNSLLTNKVMYCYNCEESDEETTKTISTTNVSENPISEYAKKGNGYAKITYLGE